MGCYLSIDIKETLKNLGTILCLFRYIIIGLDFGYFIKIFICFTSMIYNTLFDEIPIKDFFNKNGQKV